MAVTIEYYESDLSKLLDEFENDVNRSQYEYSNRQKWISDCNKKILKINDLIAAYEHQLNQLSREENTIYVPPFKTLESRFKKIKETFISKKGQKNKGNNSLFDEREENIPLDQMNVEQLITRGDDLQDKMVNIIQGMNLTLDQTILLSDEINLKLEGQIEQLNRMTERVKDTGTTLKKAQKHIAYFKKALQCDKWLAALLFLNLIALVTLIVLVVKKSKK